MTKKSAQSTHSPPPQPETALTTVKTLEFKLDLTTAQQQQIDHWLEIQRCVWNRGLAMLKRFEKFAAYNKHDKAYAPCCPVPWKFRYIPNAAGDGYVAVPYNSMAYREKWGEYRQFCPLLPQYETPELDRDSEYSLTPLFAFKLPGNEWLRDSGCPYKLTQGTIKLLATSWQEYRKNKRKSPRFKGDRNLMMTLNDTQTGNASVDGDWVQLPKLGRVKIKSANRRWIRGLVVKTYRILKRPSGYYLMLVGAFAQKPLKVSDKACGIDPGVAAAVSLDDGRQFPPANPLKRQLKRLQRLQRQASRQKPGSNGQEKTYQQIRTLHEKVKRSRNAFNHKLSTKLVREYGAIAVENTNLRNITRRPKSQLNEDGKGWKHNKAAQKAGLNRALLDVAIGDLRDKIKTKCKAFHREFELTPAQHTSQMCHACGEKGDRRSQSEFICLNPVCSLHEQIQNADGNAAKNHLQHASFRETGKYRAWAWELKRETAVSSPPSGTTPATGETVSHSGVPEATTSASVVTVALSHELLAPIAPQSEIHREPLAVNARKSDAVVPQKGRKRRSAPPPPDLPIQLTLWSAAGEIDSQSG